MRWSNKMLQEKQMPRVKQRKKRARPEGKNRASTTKNRESRERE